MALCVVNRVPKVYDACTQCNLGNLGNLDAMDLYPGFFRPILFLFDPEWVHRRTLAVCGTLGRNRLARSGLHALYDFEDPRLRITVAGVDFPNPLGLAAGFDKNAVALDALAALGFGSLEVGSVSAIASEGNLDRPRLFRLPADEAMMVYYGVPNDGAAAVAARPVDRRAARS